MRRQRASGIRQASSTTGEDFEGANRHDKKLVEATLESIPVDRPEPTEEDPQGLCLQYCSARVLLQATRHRSFRAHVLPIRATNRLVGGLERGWFGRRDLSQATYAEAKDDRYSGQHRTPRPVQVRTGRCSGEDGNRSGFL